MSAFSSTSKLFKLLNDIFIELDKFTIQKFTYNCKLIVNNLYNVSLPKLVKFLLLLRHLNNLPFDNSTRNKCYKKIRHLLASINNLDDGDTHAIGQDLSIDMYSTLAQDILNVKRLSVAKINTSNSDLSPESFEYFVKNTLNLEYKKILPECNGTIIHKFTNDKCWFRLKILYKNIDELKSIINNLMGYSEFSNYITGMYLLCPTIIEVYYTSLHKLQPCINFLNSCDSIDSIIFYSNLKTFKDKCECVATKFSNIIKFYYCSMSKELDFVIKNMSQMRTFNRVYLYSVLLLNKDNMNVSNDDFSSAPLSCLSGNNPNKTIKIKSRNIEPLTNYDKNLLECKDADLRDTAISKESLKYNSRHVIHCIDQDRDQKILTNNSLIGGFNLHEIVIKKF